MKNELSAGIFPDDYGRRLYSASDGIKTTKKKFFFEIDFTYHDQIFVGVDRYPFSIIYYSMYLFTFDL